MPESRSAWGVSVCPESSPVDGSSNPAEVDADRFMPWFDMEVAPKDEVCAREARGGWNVNVRDPQQQLFAILDLSAPTCLSHCSHIPPI